MDKYLKYALAALAVTAGSLSPRAAAAQRDSVVLEIAHRDSSSTLTLTPDAVVFRFTREGVDRVARRTESNTTNADGWLAGVVRQSVVGALRGMRVAYRFRDIESARAEGATVYLEFRTRSDDNSFDFDAIDARSAQAFVKRLNELLSRR